jgi:hypothetical protein
MLKKLAVAAVVPAAFGLASFVGVGTASASANLTHADCVGIAASTANAAKGQGAGGALISGVAKAAGGVGTLARTDCASGTGTAS